MQLDLLEAILHTNGTTINRTTRISSHRDDSSYRLTCVATVYSGSSSVVYYCARVTSPVICVL